MYRQKLNPRLLFHFQSRLSQELGLVSMLTPSTAHSKHSNSSELQRFTRLEETKHRERLFDSALKIQKNFRMFSAVKNLKRLKREKEFRVQTKSALKIQAFYRGFYSRKRASFLKLSRKIFQIRDQAARMIQKRCKFVSFKRKVQVFALAAKAERVRNMAARVIQKRVRGFFVRKDLFFVKSGKVSMLVCWRYPARNVFISGSFTFPPWKVEIPLVFSRYLNGFFSGFFIENRLDCGEYLLKFIVDGTWLCDGKYPLTQDSEGNYNNVIKINPPKPRLGTSRSSNELNLAKQSRKIPRNDLKNTKNHYFRYFNRVFLNNDSNTSVQLSVAKTSKKDGKILEFFNENLGFFSMVQPFGGFSSFRKISENFSTIFPVLQKTEKKLEKIRSCQNDSGRLFEEFRKSLKKIKKTLDIESFFAGFSSKNVLNFLNFGTSRLFLFRKRVKTGQYLQVFASGSSERFESFRAKTTEKSCKTLKNIQSSKTESFQGINQALKFSEAVFPEADVDSIELQPDDVVLLATEGIFACLTQDEIGSEIERFSNKGFTSEYFCERLALSLEAQAEKRTQNNHWRRKGQVFNDFAFHVIVGLACRGLIKD